MKFRFHVISLPHTQTPKDFSSCAFTEKVRKFCVMMKSFGHSFTLGGNSLTLADITNGGGNQASVNVAFGNSGTATQSWTPNLNLVWHIPNA